MKRLLKYAAWTIASIVVLTLGAWAWAHYVAMERYEKHWTVHDAGFPIPFPLSADELDALRLDAIAAGANPAEPLAGVDLAALALERAIARGQHLVESRVACHGCHASDFGGSVVVDDWIAGQYVAPNLTSGEGSVTVGYTANDWDRAVRHAVRRDGRTSGMPSEDYHTLSDHELSDIVAYITSLPPVDRDVGKIRIGPLFAFLIATEPDGLATYTIDHDLAHATEPPSEAPTAEMGAHIVQVCRSCHGPNLSGGTLEGDPDMPVAANLTPHETGLKSWTEADFMRSLRDGIRKDGTAISETMPWKAYGQMSDMEIKAMWAYLQTLPPLEKGSR